MSEITKAVVATREEISNITYQKGKIKSIKTKTLLVDDVAPKDGDIILIKDQGVKSQNGLYQVKRNCAEKVFVLLRYKNREHDKDLIHITGGKLNPGTKWTCNNAKSKEVEYISIGSVAEEKIAQITPFQKQIKSTNVNLLSNGMSPVMFGESLVIPATGKYVIMVQPNESRQKFMISINGELVSKYNGQINVGSKISVYYIGGSSQNLGCTLNIRSM